MLGVGMLSINPAPQIIKPPVQQQANTVTLPHLFTPRGYQTDDLFRPLFPHHYPDLRMLDVPRKKRIALVWHRRAGKDKSIINALALAAYEEPGNYVYLLPEQTQAKKVIWRGIGKDGVRFIDHIPPQIIHKKYESEMLVEINTKCGNISTIQIGGADNYDSWMGTNPRGIVLSEYSLQDPMAWEYLRPILVENGGWAVFIYTVRGKNHGFKLYNIAKNNPDVWHCSLLTIDDTKREDGSPVITKEMYLQEIEDGMDINIAKAEFYCDFNASIKGSYYGDLIEKMELEKKIGFAPYDPGKLVYTAWDIGLDANCVWYAQPGDNGKPRFIDYYEKVDERWSDTLRHAIQDKPYHFGAHFAPHDIKNRDAEKKNVRLEKAEELGIDFIITPRSGVDDGIEEVRRLLPQCQIDAEHCERGIDGLRSYERVYDDKLQRFRDQPVHNWASHPSDAFRTMAMNWEDNMGDGSWDSEPLDLDASQFV